jgi:O-antigen/teichoic acid export membrane protein
VNELRRNAIASAIGRVATALLWIAVTPFVLSRLGPERFGIWSLFFAFNSYLISLDFGIGSTILRFIAAQRSTSNRQALVRTIRLGMFGAVALGVLWAVVIAVARDRIATAFHVPAAMMPEAMDALLVFGIGVLLVFPTQTILASLQGFERLDLSNLSLIVGVTAQTLALYVGLGAGGGLKAAALAGVLGQAVTGLLGLALTRRQLHGVAPGSGGKGPEWRDMMNFSVALQLIGVLLVLQFQSGRIVVGLLGNLGMVANYELASRMAFAVYSLPALIIGAVVPTASRIGGSGNWEAVLTLFGSTSRWIHLVTVVTLGLFWLLASDMARIWLGPGHEEIAHLMRLWAVAYAISLAYAPGIAVARGIGKPWFEVWSYCVAVLANIGLAIQWVPRYGNTGAVAAAVASFGMGFLTFSVLFHRRSGIPFGPWFQRELLPRAVAGLLTVALAGGLVSLGPATGMAPGWTHGVVATLLFLAIFALLFLPLGDTQRLVRMVWQVGAAALGRRRGLPSAS